MIYLDYQATTPLAPEAFAAMLPWLATSTPTRTPPHRPGRAAKAAVEVARDRGRGAAAARRPRRLHQRRDRGAQLGDQGDDAGRSSRIATEHAAVLDTVAAEARGGRRRDGAAGAAATASSISPRADGRSSEGRTGRRDARQQRDRRDPAGRRARRRARTRPARCSCATRSRAMAACRSPRNVRPGRGVRAQDPRSQGHRRAVDPRRRRRSTPLLHGGDQEGGRSGTLRPRCAPASASRRALMRERAGDGRRARRTPWTIAWTIARSRARSPAGRSTARPNAATTAISTSAAPASTSPG